MKQQNCHHSKSHKERKMIAALTAPATCSIKVIKMIETVCWLCHTCWLKPPAGPISYATSCNLYAYNLYNIYQNASWKSLATDWCIIIPCSVATYFFSHNLTGGFRHQKQDFHKCLDCAPWYAQNCLDPDSKKWPGLCFFFSNASISLGTLCQGMGSYKHIFLIHLWGLVLCSTQLQPLLFKQKERKRRKRRR